MSMSQKYKQQFEQLVKLQETIKHIHPLLQHYYPIAIVEDGNYHIFDYNMDCKEYRLEHVEKDTMNTPIGVRAAFPLECYDNRAAAVVSGEIFDSVGDQIAIFHENVHCYQFETCELKLRSQFDLARNAVQIEGYYWELQYPFPYEDAVFVGYVSKVLEKLAENNLDGVSNLRREIRSHLTREQVEYMVWQEWKEGFARYIENVIRRELGIQENHFVEQPYGRTIFYEMGSRLIEFIHHNGGDLADIEALYHRMNEDTW